MHRFVRTAAVAYFDALNPEQRQAVEHGIATGRGEPMAPSLIIADAGSGKISTLVRTASLTRPSTRWIRGGSF